MRGQKSRGIENKNYYDQLESTLKVYEAKVKTLEDENKFLKHKLNLYETGRDTCMFEQLHNQEDQLFSEFKVRY